MEGRSTIVFDNGSGYTKIGFSGEDHPRNVFPTIIGHRRFFAIEERSYEYGNEADRLRSFFEIQFPIIHGKLDNRFDLDKLWEESFRELITLLEEDHNYYLPDHQCVLLTESPKTDKKTREIFVALMFEQYRASQVCLINQQVLSLFSSGKTTGLVIDSGYQDTNFVPVFDGCSLRQFSKAMTLGGIDATDYLISLYENLKGYSYQSLVSKMKKMKEDNCYVALDFEKELNKNIPPIKYKLEKTTTLEINQERFKVPEILFKPDLCGKEDNNIIEYCFNTLNQSDIEIRKELYQNIFLSGGNTMFNGLKERLYQEMTSSTLNQYKEDFNIIANPERQISTWVGGSLISSLSSFNSICLSQEEYIETGPPIIQRKVF